MWYLHTDCGVYKQTAAFTYIFCVTCVYYVYYCVLVGPPAEGTKTGARPYVYIYIYIYVYISLTICYVARNQLGITVVK